MISRLHFIGKAVSAAASSAMPLVTTRELRLVSSRRFDLRPQFPETPISPTFDHCQILNDGTLIISVFSTSHVFELVNLTITRDLGFPFHGSPDAIARGLHEVFGVFSAGMGLPNTGDEPSIIRVDLATKKYETLSFPTHELPGYLLPIGDVLYATNGTNVYEVARHRSRGRDIFDLGAGDRTIVASDDGFWAFARDNALFFDPLTKKKVVAHLSAPFDGNTTKLRGSHSGCYTLSTVGDATTVRHFRITSGCISEGVPVAFDSGALTSEPSVDPHDRIWSRQNRTLLRGVSLGQSTIMDLPRSESQRRPRAPVCPVRRRIIRLDYWAAAEYRYVPGLIRQQTENNLRKRNSSLPA